MGFQPSVLSRAGNEGTAFPRVGGPEWMVSWVEGTGARHMPVDDPETPSFWHVQSD